MFDAQFDAQSHEMQLECTHPSGAEEWLCPTCGRRFLMQWPPAYKKIVLDQGDMHATHTGGKGGLRMGATQIMPAEEILPTSETLPGIHDAADSEPDNSETPITDELRPWLKWLESADLDSDEAA